MRKLQYVRGEEVGTSKLTEQEVREIRTSSETNKAIAKRLGVSRCQVSAIRHRKAWAWVK